RRLSPAGQREARQAGSRAPWRMADPVRRARGVPGIAAGGTSRPTAGDHGTTGRPAEREASQDVGGCAHRTRRLAAIVSERRWRRFERDLARDVGTERIPVTGERDGADFETAVFVYS